MKNIFLKFIFLVIASTQLFAENIPLSSNRANPNAPSLGYRDFPNNSVLNVGQSWPSYPSNYATSFTREMYLGLIWSTNGSVALPSGQTYSTHPIFNCFFPPSGNSPGIYRTSRLPGCEGGITVSILGYVLNSWLPNGIISRNDISQNSCIRTLFRMRTPEYGTYRTSISPVPRLGEVYDSILGYLPNGNLYNCLYGTFIHHTMPVLPSLDIYD